MQSVDLVNVAGDWHFGNNGCLVFLVKNERAIEIVSTNAYQLQIIYLR